jgi:hypothetical protein
MPISVGLITQGRMRRTLDGHIDVTAGSIPDGGVTGCIEGFEDGHGEVGR